MIGFLNEQSLADRKSLESGLTFFLSAAQELSLTDAILFKDSRFFFSAEFAQEFNALGFPKDIRALIRQLVFGERYYKCWRPQRLSNDDEVYTSVDPRLKSQDQSICEAAERKLRNNNQSASILSSTDSPFRDRYEITISKNSTNQLAQLRGLTSVEMVENWIAEQRGYYDPRSAAPPKDFQTVLIRSHGRFRATGKIERGGRKVFEEIETGKFYYVCSGHPGESAHLEVFSKNHEHLGKADINSGAVDDSKRINGRRLRF